MAEPETGALLDRLFHAPAVERRGRVVSAVGTAIRVSGLEARIGETCTIADPAGGRPLLAEVVGLEGGLALLTPLGPLRGVAAGAQVMVEQGEAQVMVGPALLGRVLDGLGRPIDGLGPLSGECSHVPLHAPSPDPMTRAPITDAFVTGVRALDALVTMGVGQRIGVFAAAGGGKSTLMGMLARSAEADVIVIALIGERGRELREFLEESLGPEGRARSVVVCATSDRPAMERVRAAHHATAIAEGFRAGGQRVLLLFDSATRFARAVREIGLAAGEPPVRRGFPPSVFAELPRLFERAGADARGTITALYTVLVEDEEGADPVGEEVRSILDGHVILSRKLGAAGHYPAIDVLQSLSRVFPRVAAPGHRAAAIRLRALMARNADNAFLVQVGEYKRGQDPLADTALDRRDDIAAFLRQDAHEASGFDTTLAMLRAIAA
jgi:type III secretion protein N (ATPase)